MDMRKLMQLSLCSLVLAWHSVFADIADFDQGVDSAGLEKELSALEAQITSQPDSAHLLAKRGAAYFKLHRFDEAIDDFTSALKLDPALDDAYFGRGMARARNGDIDAGISDLSVYLQRNPDSSVAYTKRGVRYLWKGDLDRAQRDLEKAIELNPANAEAHDDLGAIHVRREDYAKAIPHFLATIRHDPTYYKAYHNLGVAYYILGKNEDALRVIEQGLRLKPDSRNSLLLKALVLKELGRHDEARAAQDEAEFMPEGNWSEFLSVP